MGRLSGFQGLLSRGRIVATATIHSIFEGYPAEVVARWCAVSVKTAQLYKSGLRRPSRQSLRLFALQRDRQVLGAPWAGWLINGDSIVDPDGNATTVGQLRAYFLVTQVASALARELGPQYQAMFHRLLVVGPSCALPEAARTSLDPLPLNYLPLDIS
jgi:hypothetical protein